MRLKFDPVVAEDVEQVARRIVDAVVTAKVAGVVIGDGGGGRVGTKLALRDQRLQIFSVVHTR